MNSIRITGAEVHNLKSVDVKIPRDALVAITGVSGSGKTSLAFDTIFAEGQRRYFETLSSYSRQFVQEMERPDVELIEGLSPAISVNQKGMPTSPRSTVGTLTEIYDYLRLLFTAAGVPTCPDCGDPIESVPVERIADMLIQDRPGSFAYLMAPLVSGRKGIYKDLIEKVARKGFSRVRVDGVLYHVEEPIEMSRYKTHDIELVVHRLEIKPENRDIILDSLATCAAEGEGAIVIHDRDREEDAAYSTRMACMKCGYSLPKLSPRMFSFNHPSGACPTCGGTGDIEDFDPDLLVPDPELSIAEGAVAALPRGNTSYQYKLLVAAMEHNGLNPDVPVSSFSSNALKILYYGTGGQRYKIRYRSSNGRWRFATAVFPGIAGLLRQRMEDTSSQKVAERLSSFMRVARCPDCEGSRLRRESLAVYVADRNIADLSTMPVDRLSDFLDGLELPEKSKAIGQGLVREVRKRVGFMMDVGLPYLDLNRRAMTLSGGEYQRVRLAAQIGTYLSGVTYVLDEPSVGLHARDGSRLLDTLEKLRDLGNTVLVVEHDEATIRRADHVVDIGPGAGRLGGRIVASGTVSRIQKEKESITGRYLSGKLSVTPAPQRRSPNGTYLKIKGASGHNLKKIDVKIPLGTFICLTGVSGSGKSSLAFDTLLPAVQKALELKHDAPLEYKGIEGVENLKRVLFVDMTPIGRTPRSTPATYTGVFDHIRKLYAALPVSRARGYKPGRFSYNVKGGRCEACQGNGSIRVEMHFLPDVFVRCNVCGGKRYNSETLEVAFKGKNIAEVLGMTAEEALPLFENIPKVSRPLEILRDIGLDYLLLGQPAPTLSTGEAQRIKLATELQMPKNNNTLYLLDEPTTGLHFSDIQKLLDIINRLVDMGNTVIVVEHNLDVIKCADWIIDLGPEGGDDGGRIVAQGPPDKICRSKISYTGKYLKKYL